MEIQDPKILIPFLAGFFLVFGGIFAAILYFYFRKMKRLRSQTVDFQGTCIEIPVLAAFIGLKGVKLLAFGHNNLNPKLRFLGDQVEFKCFRTKRRPYSEIELVDVFRASSLATQNLELHFKGSSFKNSFNVVNAENLKRAISFLREKACPLSQKAQNLLKGID